MVIKHNGQEYSTHRILKNLTEKQRKAVYQLLALGINKDTPQHRVRYLIDKAEGRDTLILDTDNTKLYERIKDASKKL